MWSNSEQVNFAYETKGPFVELKNELIILSFIFFLHYGSQKSKIFKNVLENVLRQQICL